MEVLLVGFARGFQVRGVGRLQCGYDLKLRGASSSGWVTTCVHGEVGMAACGDDAARA